MASPQMMSIQLRESLIATQTVTALELVILIYFGIEVIFNEYPK